MKQVKERYCWNTLVYLEETSFITRTIPKDALVCQVYQFCGPSKAQRSERESTPQASLCCLSSSFRLPPSSPRHVIFPNTSNILSTHQFRQLSGNSDTGTDQLYPYLALQELTTIMTTPGEIAT